MNTFYDIILLSASDNEFEKKPMQQGNQQGNQQQIDV